jgi:RHH-type rel operon transcriptional repressor/antitoxin RelB
MIALRLPPEAEERLEALAQRMGRSVDEYPRDAILGHLEDLEDVEIADRRLEALRRGESDTIPLADVLKQYGMDH